MDNPILLMRLEGPVQSWGTRSRWDIRDTGLEPTKSGVIGLLGCALGLGRGDTELERLDKVLLFGVRIDRPGVVSTDYHTVTGYHRTAAGEFKHRGGSAKNLAKAQEHGESTIVSPRDYLHDASFLVALSVRSKYHGDNGNLLSLLENSLKNPKWPIYLGRKACVPSRPVFDKLTGEYESMENAFTSEPWTPHPLVRPRYVEAWLESADGEYERQDAMRLNQLRFYDFRRCKRIEINSDDLRRTL